MHGSTYPAHTGFDIPLGGQSWMEYIASRGYDVYCLDVRGYGRSTRPKAMAEPPQNNPPVARTPDAVKDITAVLNFILKRRSIAKLNLLGWSWGCTLMATTAIQNPDKVARLMLYAPGWLRTTPSPLGRPRPARRLPHRDARAGPGALAQRRARGQSRRRSFRPAGSSNGPTPPGRPIRSAPSRIRRWCARRTAPWRTPHEFWTSGKTMYDPAKITVPTLIAIGEWDKDTPPYMAQTIFPLLVNSPGKRLVMLAEGTHHMMLEKNREALFRAVQAFLDEGCE